MLYNIKHPEEIVDFRQAVMRGIGSDGGLYFPKSLPYFKNISDLLEQDFISRSIRIMTALLDGVVSESVISSVITEAFNFPLDLVQVKNSVFALELFHGPTLAFKDFGARFMARMLSALTQEKITIVTATSGDTGAAVAHAFYDIPTIQVVILYPHQKISVLQEKLFCTLGGNIHTFAVKGDFDDCQSLVKQCFADKHLGIRLNSANSINISRVFAQCLYYFEALARLKSDKKVVVSVPSGNFGNLTAGLLAQSMGLAIDRFVAATNDNDTVPRYLAGESWQPRPTQATLSNAMDVSQPNNWPRIEELMKQRQEVIPKVIKGQSFSDSETEQTMRGLKQTGYIAEPHSAIAYAGLKSQLKSDEAGIFLCTAHPAKFKSHVDRILEIDTPLPQPILDTIDKPLLSKVISNDYGTLAGFLKEFSYLP